MRSVVLVLATLMLIGCDAGEKDNRLSTDVTVNDAAADAALGRVPAEDGNASANGTSERR